MIEVIRNTVIVIVRNENCILYIIHYGVHTDFDYYCRLWLLFNIFNDYNFTPLSLKMKG